MIGKIENEMNFVFSENDFYANFSLDVSLLQMAPKKLTTKRAWKMTTGEDLAHLHLHILFNCILLPLFTVRMGETFKG